MPALVTILFQLWRYARHHRLRRDGVLWVQRSDLVVPFVLAGWKGPIVLTIHGSSAHDKLNYRNPIKTALYAALERIGLRACQRIILITHEADRYYRDRFPALAERFRYIPTHYDDSLFCPMPSYSIETASPCCRANGSGPCLLYVGRLHHAKRVDRALRLLAAYREQSPGARLTIAGEGEEMEALRGLAAELGIDSAASFVGTVDGSDLARLYRSSDVLVLPSEFEGLPLVLLEALGCGTPVLASDVGGVKDIVHNGVNGYRIADWEDLPAVSAKLDAVLDSAGIREKCVASVQDYCSSRVVPMLEAICEEALG